MYKTELGFQGVPGIMADYGISILSEFDSEQEIRDYFTVANCLRMFGVSDETPLTQIQLDEIADELLIAWKVEVA